MYRDFGVTKIVTNYDTNAGHSFPTDDYGNPCGTTQSPYITNCGFDGAGAALQQIYGKLKPKTSPVTANVCFPSSPLFLLFCQFCQLCSKYCTLTLRLVEEDAY